SHVPINPVPPVTKIRSRRTCSQNGSVRSRISSSSVGRIFVITPDARKKYYDSNLGRTADGAFGPPPPDTFAARRTLFGVASIAQRAPHFTASHVYSAI